MISTEKKFSKPVSPNSSRFLKSWRLFRLIQYKHQQLSFMCVQWRESWGMRSFTHFVPIIYIIHMTFPGTGSLTPHFDVYVERSRVLHTSQLICKIKILLKTSRLNCSQRRKTSKCVHTPSSGQIPNHSLASKNNTCDVKRHDSIFLVKSLLLYS